MSKLSVIHDPITECVVIMGGATRSKRGLFIAMSTMAELAGAKDPIAHIKGLPTVPAMEGFDEVPAGTPLSYIGCENGTAFFQLQNDDSSIVFTAGFYPGNLFTIKVPVSDFIELLGDYKAQFGAKEEAPAKPAKVAAKGIKEQSK
ncbi:hypothetical protein MQM1_060 [Aeromonas phage vB_AsaP_MQM1]|nr:hypothetical protein MQM1_060 [Aeromonas phage vB_AsaP_MQM1]